MAKKYPRPGVPDISVAVVVITETTPNHFRFTSNGTGQASELADELLKLTAAIFKTGEFKVDGTYES